MSEKKFGILVYEELKGRFNIGDYIQSLAAQSFFENYTAKINREKSAYYDGDEINLIMNGWFTHTTTNEWIPSEKIKPLLISFHLNHSSVPYLLNKEGIEFFKKNQPIGCRDEFTVNEFKKRGIDAYFSGCLTLTLDRYKKSNVKREGIYIVDPLYDYPQKMYIMESYKSLIKSMLNGDIFKTKKIEKHMKKIFSQELLEQAEYITQVLPGDKYTYEEKFKIADSLLEKYSTAKLVITSRIHCALPCLAMGTPVIYINGFDSFFDTCRFEGILELFNRVDVNKKTGSFIANFDYKGEKITSDIDIHNKDDYLILANKMKKICEDFVK
ncbi:MAG: polysaccharide pyruvyl transferase family protein [Acinetobacter sp.]|uniref:polysaccharide pyruvyl transferase family protein n=1 Tax=Acinetobacter sp. TaxID=472 RepID=UPI003D04D53B